MTDDQPVSGIDTLIAPRPMAGTILLVNGQLGRPRLTEPISILALAAYLHKQGFPAVLYDPQLAPGEHDLAAELLAFSPWLIGISVLAYQYREQVLALVQTLRENGYRGFLCVGGQDPSVDWQEYLDRGPHIDAVVIGEGEITLRELITALRGGDDWRNVPGLAFRDMHGRPARSQPRQLSDLAEFPFLDRGILLAQLDRWGREVVTHASMLSGRGCYGHCSFCSIMAYYDLQVGERFRLRSVESILDEMGYVYRLTGCQHRRRIPQNHRCKIPHPVGDSGPRHHPLSDSGPESGRRSPGSWKTPALRFSRSL